MLKGIPPTLSPELLKTMHEMGHGDRLLLADAHFPGHSLGQRVLRADGLLIAPLLKDILQLFQLDAPENPLAMMRGESGSSLDMRIEEDYLLQVRSHTPDAERPARLSRSEFYAAAQHCYAVVLTGDTRPYGNLILTKGVTPSVAWSY